MAIKAAKTAWEIAKSLLGKKKIDKIVTTPKLSVKEKFMQQDPFVRKRILDIRESAKKGDVYKGTSVMDTPSKERSAASIKKFWGPRSYQLTDPARKRKAGGGIAQRGLGRAFMKGGKV